MGIKILDGCTPGSDIVKQGYCNDLHILSDVKINIPKSSHSCVGRE